MTHLYRGVAPQILLSQIHNTMPYLMNAPRPQEPFELQEPVQLIRKHATTSGDHRSLTHDEYFFLCLAAHFLTCGTPVPTDVDNQIRFKLWPKELSLSSWLSMSEIVLRSRNWDFTLMSNRWLFGAAHSPWQNFALSGHLGEWFTVAVAAYAASRHYRGDDAVARQRQQLYDAIAEEIDRHSEIFASLWKSGNGLAALKASALIAHNLGDLDRVMDMWAIAEDDPLKTNFYKLGRSPFGPDKKLRYQGRLWIAVELYKSPIDGSSMAAENHRHFALRKPRFIRSRPLFCIPIGPFFDEWGGNLAQALLREQAPRESKDLIELIDALSLGWKRLPGTAAYGRALVGVLKVFPDVDLSGLKASKVFKKRLSFSQNAFESHWSEQALRWIDEIPSRA